MENFNPLLLKQIHIPEAGSHKGQNGKLLLIGGSHLFHSASLWALKVSSRIVDMVFYASILENNEIVAKAKEEFHDGIVIPRDKIDDYAKEADCILIGPGMVRDEEFKIQAEKQNISSLTHINALKYEGEQTYYLTKYLLEHYPEKKFVIDAGALQMLDLRWLKQQHRVLLTPHKREFASLFSLESSKTNIQFCSSKYECLILVKGLADIVCSADKCTEISGGNAGMTKGGTGDVLAGLIAALACNNELELAAIVGSYINKKAGENLFKDVSYYFNASDLVNEIPRTMKQLLK